MSEPRYGVAKIIAACDVTDEALDRAVEAMRAEWWETIAKPSRRVMRDTLLSALASLAKEAQ